MSQNLHRRAVAALGELYLLTGLQELLDISLEQLETIVSQILLSDKRSLC